MAGKEVFHLLQTSFIEHHIFSIAQKERTPQLNGEVIVQ